MNTMSKQERKQMLKNAVRNVLVETMEARRMLAADATLAGGLLTITGTGAADVIQITKSGSKLKVDLGATDKEFNYSDVNAIVANLFGNNDILLTGEDVNKPMNVYGGSGNDVIVTGGGDDNVFGEGGNDWMNVNGGDDVMDGGSGNDTADYSNRTADLFLSADNIANDGGAGGHDNIKSNVESILGGSGDDNIKGTDAANFLSGNDGNDTIWAYGGNDTVSGGNGSDVLRGGNDNDSVTGGNQNDTVQGDNGNDTVRGQNHNDKVYGGNGNDSVYGGEGNDTVDGGANTDRLFGENGNDKSYGGSGTDYLIDNAGADYHEGGSGTDYFFVDLANNTQSDEFLGGTEFDWIYYNGRDEGVRIQTDNVANDGFIGDAGHSAGVEKDNVHSDIEGLQGTAHEDGIYAGSAHNHIVALGGGDFIQAGSGNDTVFAGTGNDWVFGENGNDELHGEGGNDSLDGGANNDKLYGEGGLDSMYGQSGNDQIFADDNIFGEIVSGGSGTDWADADSVLAGVWLDAVSGVETIV